MCVKYTECSRNIPKITNGGGGCNLISYAENPNTGINTFKDDQNNLTGNNIKTKKTYALTPTELNKALFQFNIECDKNVSNIELKELLALSGVKKANGTVIDVENDLKNSSSNSKINISDAKAFFKDSRLIKFDLNQVSEDPLKPIVDTVQMPSGIADKYVDIRSSIRSKYYESDFTPDGKEVVRKDDLDTEDAWNEITTDDLKELEGIYTRAISAAKKCYDLNSNSTVEEYITGAESAKTAYDDDTVSNTAKLKRVNLAKAVLYAVLAPAYSVELKALSCGFKTTDYTRIRNAWGQTTYNLLKNVSGSNFWNLDRNAVEFCEKLYDSLPGLDYIVNLATSDGVFNVSTQMSLDETSSTVDKAPANSDGKFRIYETSTLKPTLYFTNEADKKTITFEIPLDFPEYTASGEKIKSFTIQESSKNSILTEKVAESGS